MSLPPRTDSLVITGMNLPPYSTRAAQQTLAPIAGATQLARTVNGALTDISDPIFQKYQSSIQCTDMQIPEFAWPGTTVVVDCVQELSYLTSGGSPERPVVAGSSRVDGTFTFYRPQLTMKVVSFVANEDEWGAIVGWTLNLEEV